MPPKYGSPIDATVLLPVLNEEKRLDACLDAITGSIPASVRILVIDGGSTDRTPELLRSWQTRCSRVVAVPFEGAGEGKNSKALQLQAGLDASDTTYVLTLDADVVVQPGLLESLINYAEPRELDILSVATRQVVRGAGLAFIHPALLTTLVYRYGIPGNTAKSAGAVQANGQCFLARRASLDRVGGFAAASDSVCEDVTVARAVASAGGRVAFAEAGDLAATTMYDSGHEALLNWSRSLHMRDRESGLEWWLGMAEITAVQALPLVRLALLAGRKERGAAYVLNKALVVARIGILVGTSRAYPDRPPLYWLSPIADVPVTAVLFRSALRRTHTWRGRTIKVGIS